MHLKVNSLHWCESPVSSDPRVSSIGCGWSDKPAAERAVGFIKQFYPDLNVWVDESSCPQPNVDDSYYEEDEDYYQFQRGVRTVISVLQQEFGDDLIYDDKGSSLLDLFVDASLIPRPETDEEREQRERQGREYKQEYERQLLLQQESYRAWGETADFEHWAKDPRSWERTHNYPELHL